MNELIKVNEDTMTVSARDLHEALQVKTSFKDWFPRMAEYGFTEGIDFNPLKIERVQTEGNREVKRELADYQITIDMAKEICMIQRTEIGKQVRQYFLTLEKAWNTPEQIMARALKVADQTITNMTTKNRILMEEVKTMQPKAEYFDALVERNLLTNFRDTAKELGIKPKKFIAFLMEHKFIYRDYYGNIKPYSQKNDGLFELKEFNSGSSDYSGVQTLITPRGRETFRLLISN